MCWCQRLPYFSLEWVCDSVLCYCYSLCCCFYCLFLFYILGLLHYVSYASSSPIKKIRSKRRQKTPTHHRRNTTAQHWQWQYLKININIVVITLCSRLCKTVTEHLVILWFWQVANRRSRRNNIEFVLWKRNEIAYESYWIFRYVGYVQFWGDSNFFIWSFAGKTSNFVVNREPHPLIYMILDHL